MYEARTLRELGIDGSLAREMESVLQAYGLTRGDRVVGYTFATPEGARYELKLGSVPAQDSSARAA